MDLVLTGFSLYVDRAPLELARDWVIQRALYRWILFIALARAVLGALRGGVVGWRKLSRTGSVPPPPPSASYPSI
jgi:hypothetical protein